jgi:heme oxygenase
MSIDPIPAKGLAVRLREATTPEHREAESASFMTQLMGGELDLDAYVAYLAQYAYVYRALEARQAQASDPRFLTDPSLARYSSVVSDLEHLGAGDWEERHPPLTATRQYVEHLESLEARDVPRYLAHHYTRYLGDLSGGQAIAKLVARHYGATEQQLAFYRFDGIDSPVVFKRGYRDGIDALDFTPEQQRTLLAEAKAAFGFNSAIFEELGQRLVQRTLAP